jgi:hypothetical protein
MSRNVSVGASSSTCHLFPYHCNVIFLGIRANIDKIIKNVEVVAFIHRHTELILGIQPDRRSFISTGEYPMWPAHPCTKHCIAAHKINFAAGGPAQSRVNHHVVQPGTVFYICGPAILELQIALHGCDVAIFTWSFHVVLLGVIQHAHSRNFKWSWNIVSRIK